MLTLIVTPAALMVIANLRERRLRWSTALRTWRAALRTWRLPAFGRA
jgi:hypothetical protein